MCFVWISQETITFGLYIISRLGFVTEVEMFAVWYGLSPYIE
jgi:hypothetical protein